MRKWLSALIAGPGGAVDEAALFVCALGTVFIASFFVLNGLIIYSVLARGQAFMMVDYATANATLFGSAGIVAGIVEGFMGYRDRCRPPGGQ